MKRLLLLLPLFLAATACSSVPATPPDVDPKPDLCSDLAAPSCSTTKSELARNEHGLGAEHTVQLMIQEPTLIGGKAADPAQWPASVYARAGSSACSATLVGDRVIFMASHCMSNGGQISFSAGANQYKARCAHHPEYGWNGSKNSTADWALCLVDRPVTGVPFEDLGISEQIVIGQTVLLTGYGCIRPGGGGGNDGIFRIGDATVRGLPSGRNYDVVTRGGAALCFGDSGGAVYVMKPNGQRSIFGVNSRGDIRVMSYLPGVFAKTFIDWAKTWATASNNVKICGIHADAIGCRTQLPPPPPGSDPNFEVATKGICVKGKVGPELQNKKTDIADSVKKTLEQF